MSKNCRPGSRLLHGWKQSCYSSRLDHAAKNFLVWWSFAWNLQWLEIDHSITMCNQYKTRNKLLRGPQRWFEGSQRRFWAQGTAEGAGVASHQGRPCLRGASCLQLAVEFLRPSWPFMIFNYFFIAEMCATNQDWWNMFQAIETELWCSSNAWVTILDKQRFRKLLCTEMLPPFAGWGREARSSAKLKLLIWVSRHSGGVHRSGTMCCSPTLWWRTSACNRWR